MQVVFLTGIVHWRKKQTFKAVCSLSFGTIDMNHLPKDSVQSLCTSGMHSACFTSVSHEDI